MNIIEILTKYYEIFNEELFDNALPKCIINIQYTPKNKKSSYCLMGAFYPKLKWERGEEELVSISITPEAINEGKIQVLSTLVHEMVHVYCDINDILDVVKKKHTEEFKNAAIKAKLDVEKDKKLGWAMTYMTVDLKNIIDNAGIDDEDVFNVVYHNNEPEKEDKPKAPKKKKYKYECPSCKRPIVAEEEIDITCKVCNMDFVLKSGPKEV